LELDHVLIAVADLAGAGQEIEARYGLTSIEGGRHPGWGTANRIVPLGDAYLELVAVIDEGEAAQSPFGSWVAQAHPTLARPLGWAVRIHKLGEVARRLDLTIQSGSRATRTGQLLRWRLAGVEQAAAESSLPFFIQWGQGTPLPGHASATHRAGAVKITKLQLDGDADRIAGSQSPYVQAHQHSGASPSLGRQVKSSSKPGGSGQRHAECRSAPTEPSLRPSTRRSKSAAFPPCL
jgi:hypothetical protein